MKKLKFISEFSEFINKGNALNLAVGVIIGGAFQSIVKSLTDDIISPIIGLFGKADFSGWVWKLKTFDDGTAVVLKYGSFITAVINFLIMAFIVFLIVKLLNKVTNILHKEEAVVEEVTEPTTKQCPYCKTEIDINATRCPHCTSVIDFVEDEDEDSNT